MTNHPSVVVISGPGVGSSLTIDEVLNDFSIGSDGSCHLVLPGPRVSPLHAALFLDDEGQVTVSDTKSRAGVFVNGAKVTEAALEDGDEISIGPPGDASPCLRFTAAGSGSPAADSGDLALPELADLELSEPLDLALLTSELHRPAPGAKPAAAPGPAEPGSTAPAAPSPKAAPAAIPLPTDGIPPLEPFTEPGALPALDALPHFEALPEVAPLPEPEPQPEALPEMEAPLELETSPEMGSFAEAEAPPEPEALPEPEARPEPEPPSPVAAAIPPPAPSTKTAAPRKPQTTRRVASTDADPLAGLAESLGGGERSAPPPPLSPVAARPAPAREKKFPAQMAMRIAAVAAVVSLLAWFGIRKYSESIVVPVIDSYRPNPAEPGQTVTINGSGFDADSGAGSVKVLLGSTELPVLDANATRLNVTVPEGLGAAGTQLLPLTVSVGDRVSAKNQFKVVVAPKVVSLTPRVALSGDEVGIGGRWLAAPKTAPVVTVGGAQAEVLEASSDKIRIRIPTLEVAPGRQIPVRVAVGADVGKDFPLLFGSLPFVESVSPERILPGDALTVKGVGLSGADLVVTVGGRSAVVLSATDSEVRISVPGIRLSEEPGRRELRVQVGGRTSSPTAVELLRESSALYSPRFYTEILEGGRAAVSTELGPVMVLGSDGPSRLRAQEAATRLNALVGQGRTSRVQFGAANLFINGPSGPVLVVAPGDGAGNPRSLAALWAAQLTDRFDLFLQGRRPGRTVELSPDGKVFLDMFATARRRSNEAGVPKGVLYSLDPSWVKSLTALASSPSYGSQEAMALLDGYWSGAIEVPGAIQPRKVEFSLTATPSGLVGQRTSRQGRLSTDVSLTRLSYGKGEIRFSFVDSGEDLNYAGRLDGDQIEGAVTRASGARVGKLTLKLTR